ncbi:hypothetical protein NUW54_g8099 [Trametes sanguinea]|uniref:Uncharacterized protein n=1 Tax=Trametes sanguinea TaxID=158606 RepID=A0ACC1PHD7_9APHY|nr:hypothetical protein NUW54_g8099 [Trametes sanguinea]
MPSHLPPSPSPETPCLTVALWRSRWVLRPCPMDQISPSIRVLARLPIPRLVVLFCCLDICLFLAYSAHDCYDLSRPTTAGSAVLAYLRTVPVARLRLTNPLAASV